MGVRQELRLLAHASANTLVTVEEVTNLNLLSDPKLAPGTIPAFYVGGVAVARGGARPLNLPQHYDSDFQQIARYAKLAKSEEGISEWVTQNLIENNDADRK